MKTVRLLAFVTFVLCAVLAFAACDLEGVIGTPTGSDPAATEPGAQTTAVPEETTPKSHEAVLISAEGFAVNDASLSLTVPNATTSCSFVDRIVVSDKATWQISTDPEGLRTIPTKTVSLKAGDNAFYLLITAEDGETVSFYSVSIRRTPIYTVSFATGGGTAIAPVQVEENELVAEPAVDPVRAGYSFAGWDHGFSAPITENLTVTAAWTPDDDTPYVVEYYLENAAGTGYDKTADPLSGTTGTRVAAEQKRFEHYTYSAVKSTPSGVISGDGSLVLKMYYLRETFTVSFLANGGTLKNGSATQSVRYGGAALRPTFTRAGYTFTGWEGDEGCDEVTRSMTIRALWEINVYTVTYELNGGTNAEGNPSTFTVEDDVALAAPTRGDDNFLGWYLPDGQKISRLTGRYASLTLTARWGVLDRWEILGSEIAETTTATDRALRIELNAYADAEKASKNDVYLKGPDAIDEGWTPVIQQMVYERNKAANDLLGTTVDYVYWSDLGWGKQAGRIKTLVQSNASNAPDLFVNMLYDLGNATLSGLFKDVWSIPGSYFDFAADGWMSDWMESLSFTGDRAYVLGGDYFLDLYRSMGVLPFNSDLMDAYGARLSNALFGSALPAGTTMSDRFFDFVENGNWTWEALGKLSEAVWIDADGDARTSLDDTLGIITDSTNGMPAALILYSSGATLTETYTDQGRQWIRYPADSSALGAIFDAVSGAFTKNGALVTTNGTGSTHENPGIGYHQIKFAQDELLFAGPTLLGSLENDAFQQMPSRYSVVPLPKVSADKPYVTVIHNAADAGAINVNANPRKAKVLSAFLQYCAENSVAIRDEFLQIVVKYRSTSYDQGTDRMLEIIYGSVVNGRDKAIEDAAEGTGANRLHAKMKDNRFTANSTYIAAQYANMLAAKQNNVDSVLNTWYTLPKAQ